MKKIELDLDSNETTKILSSLDENTLGEKLFNKLKTGLQKENKKKLDFRVVWLYEQTKEKLENLINFVKSGDYLYLISDDGGELGVSNLNPTKYYYEDYDIDIDGWDEFYCYGPIYYCSSAGHSLDLERAYGGIEMPILHTNDFRQIAELLETLDKIKGKLK